MLSRSEAIRFLQQATFGGRPVDVANLQAIGIDAWIDEQIAMPQTASHLERAAAETIHTEVERSLWKGFITEPDQLRKRWAYSLSQIFVASSRGVGGAYAAAYADILEQHGFGTYRDLIEKITYSPAMAKYLTYHGNRRAGSYRDNVPDENYSREIMQLFSIGLWELNPDGTRRLDAAGAPIPSYDQDDVAGLARVFTGLRVPGLDGEPLRASLPCDPEADFSIHGHEFGEKRFLGTVIPAVEGRPRGHVAVSIAAALDHLAAHPNVGPFLGRQFIQRLVTSNPTPAYVGRVAAVFDDDGSPSHVRGNLGAVVRAILTDPEARTVPTAPTAGKLREPVLRFTTIARSINMDADGNPWPIRVTSEPSSELGQTPYSAPSVFNFYRPGYVPPQSELGDAGMNGPEFQIYDESSSVGWVNFVLHKLTRDVFKIFNRNTPEEIKVFLTRDYSGLLELATGNPPDPAESNQLIDEIVARLCPHGLDQRYRDLAVQAIAGVTDVYYDRRTPEQKVRTHRERVAAAMMIVAVSPDFLHER